MGYDFTGKNGGFSLNVSGWPWVYNLAVAYGWRPAGTVGNAHYYAELSGADMNDPKTQAECDKQDREWDGRYSSNDFQQVTAEDADNLAEALENALRHLPRKESTIPENVEVSPIEEFSGLEERRWLREFIEFCRAGSFTIG